MSVTMNRVTEADLTAAMVAVWDADRAWDSDLDSVEAKQAYKAAKAAYKTLADRCEVEGWPLTECGRCGGQGGWKGWPGFTCYDCGGSTKMPMKRVRFEASPPTRAKKNAARRAVVEAREREADAKWQAFEQAYPAEAKFLDETFKMNSELDPDDEVGVGFDHFFSGLKEKARRFGSLSEKQVACITREMEKRAEVATAREFPKGTVEVEGEIVSLPPSRSYTGGTVTKMLLKLSGDHAGNRVMGTIPEKVWAAMDDDNGDQAPTRHGSLIGSRVRFTATFNRSADDEHFGFFKSPKGVTVTHVNWESVG